MIGPTERMCGMHAGVRLEGMSVHRALERGKIKTSKAQSHAISAAAPLNLEARPAPHACCADLHASASLPGVLPSPSDHCDVSTSCRCDHITLIASSSDIKHMHM